MGKAGSKPNELAGTKNLMGALVRMKPKPHEEMKIGKSRQKTPKSPTKTIRNKTRKPGGAS